MYIIQQKWFKTGLASIEYNVKPATSKHQNNTAEELSGRLRNMMHACSAKVPFLRVYGREPVFFRSNTTNISCCKVPKTGSSFWGAVIMAIESTNTSRNVFNINRNTIHGHNEVTIHKVVKSDTKILIGRDPYTRLFSAFIDKYFLLGNLGRSLRDAVGAGPYRKDGNICGYNVTFSQFLEDITHQVFKGFQINEHLIPVSDLCDVCGMKYDMLIRQETLNRDTQHLLRKVDLTAFKRTAIQVAVSPRGIKQTIHSLIASYLTDYATYRKDCPSRVLHMEKVWATLQIQGYVNTGVSYPKQLFENIREYKADNITSIVLHAIESRPMTNEEKIKQRATFVRRAYEVVEDETIRKVQTVFMKDFILLNYDLTPPHKR
ncbi:carbohydrate sulfotransferase 10-like isoform X2 [Mizuhopecten yessoensis]|uniref:Carbohydrate sulfotransferase n=2 Tax=Mizuhopecten yessoensis TaxID=6573 RepID=A0A210QM43_MIZYE|nr:carbohydrate sulfotransferase 10-like isoform X2 [Mizuhopecten yessoensis]XP_021354897.1 carbohydrate sulfotransferase 10-like isoform X2 [Mizuhopecten yessoensis]OWF49761.1 Carbohydrate sulfotransferase 10 [Mizuhopecten yessoensis]